MSVPALRSLLEEVGRDPTAPRLRSGAGADMARNFGRAKAKAILTNVVASLEANPARVFHYVEQVYFRRWWLANPGKHESVRQLVKQKRLMFMTGGLCMNDEATTHHGAIIDQMSWGMRFINTTFGPEALPTVGWQIDSFGHSAGYSRLTVDMGFSTFIGQKVSALQRLT